MVPRIDAGDLLLFYRIEKNPKAQDIVVIDKAVNTDYSAVTVQPEAETPWWRAALNWLGFRDPAAPETHSFVSRVVAAPEAEIRSRQIKGLPGQRTERKEAGSMAKKDIMENPVPVSAASKATTDAVLTAFKIGNAMVSLLSGLLASVLILYSGYVLYDSFSTE